MPGATDHSDQRTVFLNFNFSEFFGFFFSSFALMMTAERQSKRRISIFLIGDNDLLCEEYSNDENVHEIHLSWK